jgi:hypothetical protein
MPVRHIYLKIETIPDYSPVDPDPTAAPPIHYGRDCMRNMGHEDTTIPTSEINARTVAAVGTRPVITSSPAAVSHGGAFTVNTPSATSIVEVILIRPAATTHGFKKTLWRREWDSNPR